ncbi:MAG TPA: helix-turn-helix domain-containing protein [Deltaproteobacteria bacterium]|jgi:AcrR family transcriptional regulator|nr:helix-turn-helix domain-containing protein [Deltaproteobacteria bacterium]HOI08174.1 helix-turn-helix domain-containing protein [Deltaproteobacteria bacterium]
MKRRSGEGEVNARERILKAAREVFSQHSYKAASTRLVARQAGVEHPLIHYYFGSKEKLFEAMTESIYGDVIRDQESWLKGLERMTPREGLSLFLDRMLDYTFANSDVLRISALNMVHIGRIEEIPGYRFVILNMARMRRALEEKLPLQGSSREIEMFIYTFYSLMVSLIGTKSCHSQLLNMDPDGPEYRAWVKDACMTLFLPWLEKLLPSRTRSAG